MNYESEFQGAMIEALKKRYDIEDETVLFHYFALRFFIYKNGNLEQERHRKIREMVQFLWEELNLPQGDVFQYKGVWMRKGISLENSVENIMESWNFENSIRIVTDDRGNKVSMDQYLKTQQEKIRKYAMNKAKAYKQSPSYPWYWKYFALQWLNEVYNVTPISPIIIEGIAYPESHLHWKRTMEEVVEACVHASEYKRNDVKSITEQDVEDFLYPRLYLIEDGLRAVARQMAIPDGRIDILAKDKNETHVVIELKVQEDKELVWQSMYYPMQIKKRFRVSKVRMITLAPSYSRSLLTVLNQLEYVETMVFTPVVRLGKIEDICIRKLKKEVA